MYYELVGGRSQPFAFDRSDELALGPVPQEGRDRGKKKKGKEKEKRARRKDERERKEGRRKEDEKDFFFFLEQFDDIIITNQPTSFP